MSHFDERMEWSLEMQRRYAIPVYKNYWALSDEQITEVDDAGTEETAAKKIDASGIDKIVEPSTGVRHIAQRFRTPERFGSGELVDPDFSLRVSSYTDRQTEYDKLLNAYRNGGNVPKIYTFGVAADVSKSQSRETGFKAFYFIDLHAFLKQFESGHIQPCSCYPNGDGSEALYFDIGDLREQGVIQDEISGGVLSSCWRDCDTASEFPNAPGVKTTGQLNLCDLDGGEA
jgi:hypothetical protein